jgi:hypothetical protein
MEEEDFEGTLVLEKLAAIGERDSFFDAVDSDDFQKAASLMKRAGVDEETIDTVLLKMEASDGSH